MKPRWKIATGLGSAVVAVLFVLGSCLVFWIFHNSPPTALVIPDVSKAWSHHHVDNDTPINNAGLHVVVDGEINGEAEFGAAGGNHKLHAGPVHVEFNALELWNDVADLNYTPINVTSGHLQVLVNIR